MGLVLGSSVLIASEREKRPVSQLLAHSPPSSKTSLLKSSPLSGEQAVKGIKHPLGDFMIGACALELGYAIGTGNARDLLERQGHHVQRHSGGENFSFG